MTRFLPCLLACAPLLACPSGGGTPGPSSFTVESHADPGFGDLPKKTVVFEIPLYAVSGVPDAKLLHAAHVMAQYLDNDEDGTVDHPPAHDAMKDADAFLFMWSSEADFDRIDLPDDGWGQDLGADETVPEWHADRSRRFDASLEEVLHLVTAAGYAQAHPEVFGMEVESDLADAMDAARGGRFEQVPDSYPDGAWYSYDDRTCDYGCMVVEYHYWALTSLLGAQAERGDEIGAEWRAHTPELMRSMDAEATSILEDPAWASPSRLPDGAYSP